MTISAEEFLQKYGKGKKPGGKYGVAPPAERTARGRVYASKAERLYADELWLRFEAGDLLMLIEQPLFRLGEDETYRPDFLVVDQGGTVVAIDRKGAETPRFQKTKKLWEKYQRIPLRVVGKSENYVVWGKRGAR